MHDGSQVGMVDHIKSIGEIKVSSIQVFIVEGGILNIMDKVHDVVMRMLVSIEN